jgi:hypothetical protein
MIIKERKTMVANHKGNYVLKVTDPQTEGSTPTYFSLSTKLERLWNSSNKVRIIKGVKA